MPTPSELLALSRRLSAGNNGNPPTDAELRRAVSTAYYALFHKILRTAAERFMGTGQTATAGYSILYRGFQHRDIKVICEAISSPTMKLKYQLSLQRKNVSQDMVDFAVVFPILQEVRHLADYDPGYQFAPSDVSYHIDAAELAMDALDRAEPRERADVLALMLVGARS